MEKRLLFLLVVFFILISGCAQQQPAQIEKDSNGYNGVDQEHPPEVQSEPMPADASDTPQTSGLGNLCPGNEECISFCLNNRGQCEAYCKGNAENELCAVISQNRSSTASIDPSAGDYDENSAIDLPPVLKNLGIILDTPNAQTKLAGDLLFDKKVVWEDGGSYSDKAFGEFGEAGKRKDIPNLPGVEYNYAVPIGTKVYAAGDGIARVFYIEHTQDWGINIQPKEGSKWNIGHEHIVNLAVKDLDVVKAGDILGEATPNRMDYATTQLSVWTGGKGIVKFCPFSFLEDNLEPAYEEKLKRLADDWEEFIGKDVYKQEDWVAPGCLLHNITER